MAKVVKDFPDYLIYEDGRVWSNKTNKFLKHAHTLKGYASVELFNTNGSKRLLIHRLVAEAYIPNPDGLPQINHKDENPRNNHVSNLEWCTAKYNMNYGEGARTRHSKIDYSNPIYRENAIKNGKKVSIPVLMFKGDKLIKTFESAKDASKKTGIAHSNILRAAHGERATAGGYVWKKMEVAI